MSASFQSKGSLYEDLQTYLRLQRAPYHMPGHKRRFACAPALPFSLDVTEVPGTDDLHHPTEMLLASMERTAALFGARQTRHLVGGSTLGNLAAIYAAVPFGGHIVCAAGCHRSIHHAVELLHLEVTWLEPPRIPEFAIEGSIAPAMVEEALASRPDVAAVVITSPTYDGVCSDIAGIARVCHAREVPLLVDQAHGAHLGLFPEARFPDSAIRQGADLVTQSTHKMLPALTQTALLHRCSDRVSQAAIDHALDLFESSSPSYPLLLSIDECVGYLKREGEAAFLRWRKRLDAFYAEAPSLRNIGVLQKQETGAPQESIFAKDPAKILLLAPGEGEALAEALRAQGFEPERVCGRSVLLMTSCMDEDDAYEKLMHGLATIDRQLYGGR